MLTCRRSLAGPVVPLPERAIRLSGGFSLIEMMVAVGVLGLLIAAALPTFSTWVANSRVRAVTENLQNGLRLAQAEAIRRNRLVVFALTDDPPSADAEATENGKSWAVFSIGMLAGEGIEFIQGGELGSSSAGVTVAGPAAVCFGFSGRLVVPTADTIEGEDCAAQDTTYSVTRIGADRRLDARVSLAGQVRLCDPARTQSDSAPDGCPAE